MKSSNNSGLHKFLSVIFIAVLLVFVVGFASNGWEEDQGVPDSGEVGNTNDETDENKDGTDNTQTNTNNGNNQGDDNQEPPNENGGNSDLPPENNQNDNKEENNPPEEIPEPPTVYINNMTGLVITEQQKNNVPLGFVFDPQAPLYGISSSEIAIEFPIEDGTTRLLSYTTDDSALWKIGSFVETRAFISSMSHFFGGIIVSSGNDDVVPYNVWDTSALELDLSKHYGAYHRENAKYVYSSYDKIGLALDASTGLLKETYKNAPFDFVSAGAVFGISDAKNVSIPYSEKSDTTFYYSEKNGTYLMYKSGSRKLDMLSGKNVSFKNVFVLFSDATTYEKASGTELVMDVMSGGRGYYVTNGTLTEITWALDEIGELNFYSLNGERLLVNQGNSYISYFKASEATKVKIS